MEVLWYLLIRQCESERCCASFGRLRMMFSVIRWGKKSILIIIFLPLTMQQIAFASEYYLRGNEKKMNVKFSLCFSHLFVVRLLESELHHNTSMAWSVHSKYVRAQNRVVSIMIYACHNTQTIQFDAFEMGKNTLDIRPTQKKYIESDGNEGRKHALRPLWQCETRANLLIPFVSGGTK